MSLVKNIEGRVRKHFWDKKYNDVSSALINSREITKMFCQTLMLIPIQATPKKIDE